MKTVGTLFSMLCDFHPYLWEVLFAGLTLSTWRAAKNNKDLVASMHFHKDSTSGKTSHHQVISTLHTGVISKYLNLI
jgi:hypothetical protein